MEGYKSSQRSSLIYQVYIKGSPTMKKFLANLFVGCVILLSVGGYQVQAETDSSVSNISLNGGGQVFSESLPDLPSRH